MATGLTRKQMKHDEFIEATFDAAEWLEHNWRLVVIVAAAVIVVVVAVLGWMQYRAHRVEVAAGIFSEGQKQYVGAVDPRAAEPGTLEAALGKFRQASEEAGGAPIGDAARYYEGLTLLRSGDLDGAAATLEAVSRDADSAILRQSASVALAEVKSRRGDVDGAVALLRGIADDPKAVYPPEQALLLAGDLERAAGREDEARKTYREVAERFAATPSAAEANQRLGL